MLIRRNRVSYWVKLYNIITAWQVILPGEGFCNRTLDTFALTFLVNYRETLSRSNFFFRVFFFARPRLGTHKVYMALFATLKIEIIQLASQVKDE